jgi:hypothetical protein
MRLEENETTMIGTLIAAAGYLLAIYGGSLLYQNAAPDRAWGTIPRTNDIIAFQREQEQEIEDREKANRLGFGLLKLD